MARMTPIERAIAGEPEDRRRRWEHRMADRGFKRMTLYVREAQVPVVDALKLVLRDMEPDDLDLHQQGLHDYFQSMAEWNEEELANDPSLEKTTTIVEETATYRAAAAATQRTERSDGGRSSRSSSDTK